MLACDVYLQLQMCWERAGMCWENVIGTTVRYKYIDWDLGDTGTMRDYDTLARSLGWLSGSGPGWQSHKNVTFSPVGHAWLPKWLRPVTAKACK